MYLPFCVEVFGQSERILLPFFLLSVCKLFQDLIFDSPKEKKVPAAAIGRERKKIKIPLLSLFLSSKRGKKKP